MLYASRCGFTIVHRCQHGTSLYRSVYVAQQRLRPAPEHDSQPVRLALVRHRPPHHTDDGAMSSQSYVYLGDPPVARHMCTRRHARHSHPQHLRVKSAAYPLAGTTHVNVIVPAPPVMRLKRTRYQLRQHRWCVLITTHQPCQTCHLCTRRPTTTPFHTPPAPAHQVRSPPTRRPTHNDAIYMRDAQFSSVQ